MANAPGHRLGQIVGEVLEEAVFPYLRDFAIKHGFYLDRLGERPARRGRKCTWRDSLGNDHDLDFVLERGGSATQIGSPVAFIEIAWRRYTKHSRAKAQEIQGAVLPLLERYADTRPFAGVVVAGAWTPQALEQLRTSGFALAHVPYQEIVAAFGRVGLDVDASERTQDAQLAEQVAQYEALPLGRRGSLVKAVQGVLHAGMTIFLLQLETAVRRRIECVVILPLYGCGVTFTSLPDAIASLREAPGLPPAQARWLRVEVSVRFSNGDEVRGSFQNPEHAVDFLNRQAQD